MLKPSNLSRSFVPSDSFIQFSTKIATSEVGVPRNADLLTDTCVMRKPVEVLVTGYLLLGGTQGTKNYCNAPSVRGMHKGDEGSKIRGAWRLQPVFAVRRV